MRGLLDQIINYLAESAAAKQYSETKGSISLSAGTEANGAYVELPKGVYSIHARFVFGSTSSSGSWIQIALGTSSGTWNESAIRVYQPSSYWSHLATSYTAKLTAKTKVYVKGACSIARSGCTAEIIATKLYGLD